MKHQIIKKGKTGIIHLPLFTPKSNYYEQKILLNESMFKVSDDCNSGWNKIWGIVYGFQHINSSFRFVFRNDTSGLKIGYYAYINGKSPQTNQNQKGYFSFKKNIQFNPNSILTMRLFEDDKLIRMNLLYEEKRITTSSNSLMLEAPKFKPFRTIAFPNIKCKQPSNTYFNFINI